VDADLLAFAGHGRVAVRVFRTERGVEARRCLPTLRFCRVASAVSQVQSDEGIDPPGDISPYLSLPERSIALAVSKRPRLVPGTEHEHNRTVRRSITRGVQGLIATARRTAAIQREAMPADYEPLDGAMTRTQYDQISSLREPVVKASKQSR